MADQLYLSYRLRGYTENNMLRHFEKMLSKFPFSRLSNRSSLLRVNAVSATEPPLFEKAYEDPVDLSVLMPAAKEFQAEDCGVQLESYWDLWQFDSEPAVAPTRVVLACFGPKFEDSEGDHLRIDFGVDSLFLPQPDVANSTVMVQSNIRSLLHLVKDLDQSLTVERRRLWTESGENFAARLQGMLTEA
ncbi:MAG TPA: hypothetical protein VMZ52_18300 [Bryobacteraceae bacterium]|nr:hypothetical protein [Bryobacteraceae bacterium]